MTDATLPEGPWLIAPGLTFLNHGSFGACPKPVFERQRALQLQMERDPVSFMVQEVPALLAESRAALASFVGAAAEDLAFVPNATYGVNAVLRSLRWSPGDELLMTDHTYNACANAIRFVEARFGVKPVVQKLPFPLASSDEVLACVMDGVTEKTKLAMLDHVTSSTALVLPIKRLVAALSARGVDTLVDGAHAPGMVPLDVPRVGAYYYTGNCHKWLCAPKGCAFLWVHPEKQEQIRPLAISHGANEPLRDGGPSRFQLEFDWTGTDDFSPYLCLSTALSWMASQDTDGWDGVRRRNRQLVLEGRTLLCEALGIAPPAPDEMIGSIASLPLPTTASQNEGEQLSAFSISPIQLTLRETHQIQVPIFFWPDRSQQLLRISAQLYNEIDDYQRLASALVGMYGR